MGLIVFILGLLFGSFANAVIWRLHLHEPAGRSREAKEGKISVTRGRSMCPNCRHVLTPKDLVPILSWLWLRGRCRYCQQPISWSYPAVELVMAGLFLLSYMAWEFTGILSYFEFVIWLSVLVALVILAVYDLRWMILPDKVQKIIFALAITQLVLYAASGQPLGVWLYPIVAAAIFGGAFYLLHAASKGKWMGGGDVKLVVNMGLLLGLQATLVALLVSFNVAALVSVGLIIAGLRSRKDLIPFGPFLIGGLIVARLYGNELVEWYLKLAGL